MSTNTTNSLTTQLEQLNLTADNIVKIVNAIREAVTSNKQIVEVEVEKLDGTIQLLSIPSNSYLYAEIQKLVAQNELITKLGAGQSTIISESDGTLRKMFSTSYHRNLPHDINTTTLSKLAIIDNNSLLADLMSPVAKAVFYLDNEFIGIDKVNVKRIVFSDRTQFGTMVANKTFAECLYTAKANSFDYEVREDIYPTRARVNRYYGAFDVLTIDGYLNDGSIVAKFNNITYNDTNSIENTRELYVGDTLVSKDGTSKYVIKSIDVFKKVVTIKQIAGFSLLSPGIEALWYSYEIADEQRELAIPLHGGEMSLVFIAPINPNNGIQSEHSKSYVLDAYGMTVVHDNVEYAFNDYFFTYVKNIGEYLKQLIEDTAIPLSLGIKPQKPYIKSNFFKVMAVNKHLSNNTDVERLNKLATEKDRLSSQISSLSSAIDEVNRRINAGLYKSASDRAADVTKLSELTYEKDQFTTLYGTAVKEISSLVQDKNYDELSSKFRIRGFWPIQTPIESPSTRSQYIIKYKVEYRYLGTSSDTVDAVSMKFKDENGNEINASYSGWNSLETPILKKILNSEGAYVWATNSVENADEININQLDIPIRPGESVEIRIKALSEAGYPATFLESDWSEIIRVDFPSELSELQMVNRSVSGNNEDLRKVELEQMFKDKGLIEHVNDSYKEKDKYFAHTALKIASGFYSVEQASITLFDLLVDMRTQLSTLADKVARKALIPTVQIVDGDNKYSVQNYSSISLFAGYYLSKVDLSKSSEYGSILEKVFYLKLSNLNADTIELLSKSPGDRRANVLSDNYKVPMQVLPELVNCPRNGQVLYLKTQDLLSNILYDIVTESSATQVPSGEYDPGSLATNAIHQVNNDVAEIAIRNDSRTKNYVVLSKTHPYYISRNNALLAQEFERIKNFTSVEKEQNVQRALELDTNGMAVKPVSTSFVPYDKHLIGYNSCGAKLFLRVNDISFIQVNSNSAAGYKELQPGETNAILIPLVFQYRMSDALGRIDGDIDLSVNDQIEYKKKISIDLKFSSDETFSFDMEVNAKFRADSLSSEDIPLVNLSTLSQYINSSDSPTPNVI